MSQSPTPLMTTLPVVPKAETGSCCSASAEPQIPQEPWICGMIETPEGWVPKISSTLSMKDRFGGWKVRCGFGRGNYTVKPGLYALGNPSNESPVFVTANYKLTFDLVRKTLKDLEGWLLVLDTKGINVWCAAGKGTFSTDELVRRMRLVSLDKVVTHRTVIVPQLGAPGMSAHLVTKRSGFQVVYGPVRVSDVPAFIKQGMKADKAMRQVQFTGWDRLVLTPVEWVSAMKTVLSVFGGLFILNGLGISHFQKADMWGILGAIFSGSVLTPVLLPWIPARRFAVKGALLGLAWAVAWVSLFKPGALALAGYLLMIPALSGFLAMNFTGCSTYTSFSGVKKEMTQVVPILVIAGGLGTLLIVLSGILS